MKKYLSIIFGQNCENITVKKAKNKNKGVFLLERANILSKKLASKIGYKREKKPTF